MNNGQKIAGGSKKSAAFQVQSSLLGEDVAAVTGESVSP